MEKDKNRWCVSKSIYKSKEREYKIAKTLNEDTKELEIWLYTHTTGFVSPGISTLEKDINYMPSIQQKLKRLLEYI